MAWVAQYIVSSQPFIAVRVLTLCSQPRCPCYESTLPLPLPPSQTTATIITLPTANESAYCPYWISDNQVAKRKRINRHVGLITSAIFSPKRRNVSPETSSATDQVRQQYAESRSISMSSSCKSESSKSQSSLRGLWRHMRRVTAGASPSGSD